MNVRTEISSDETGNGRHYQIERLVNIVLIVVTLIFVASVAKRFLQRDTGIANQGLVIKNGMKLDWPDVDWSKNGRTLVVALSTTCHFCTESAPFYQRIVRGLARHGSSIKIVAVLPQPVTEGRKYVQGLGLSVDEVREADMPSLGLRATPILLVVNDAGLVTGTWVGKLGVSQQYDVLKHLEINPSRGLADDESAVTSIDSATLSRANVQNERFTLVDSGSRESFKLGHIPGSRNIPMDELEARADDELKPSDAIVIYSHEIDDDTSEIAVDILVHNGFNKVSLLSGGYGQWKQSASSEAMHR